MSDSILRHDATVPASSQPRAGAGPVAVRGGIDWLFVVAVLLIAATFVRVIWFTPLEALQGAAQKIFYLHLPAAFIALYIAFPLVVLMSVLFLWLKDLRFDRIAEASAEVGVVFMTVVLTTGPLWGKPIWGTWWTWDARLTLSLFIWFIYIGYLVLRGAIDDPQMRGRYSAVLGILGALLIPFIHLSVYLFRTLHPMPVVLKPSAPSLPPVMLKTLLLSFLSFTVLYIALLRARVRLAAERAWLELEDRR
jgi:heme exporter protein C